MIQTIGQVLQDVSNDKKEQSEYPLRFKIGDAPQTLLRLLRQVVPEAQWLAGYDEVAAWMSDNKGKGLLLSGGCGVGKTVIATKIVPAIIDTIFERRVKIFKATDLADKVQVENIKYYYNKVIDDIGTEKELNDYGVRSLSLCDVVDSAEKRGDFLVLTTNLRGEGILARYGERTFDRLRAMCRVVTIQGESLRR